jgi:hypothetical protein
MLDNDEEEEQLFSIAFALLASDLRSDIVERQCMNG